MKQVLLSAALMAAVCSSATAQITLEKRYPEQTSVIKLSTGELKYVTINYDTRQVSVYNANHSVMRQFVAPAPAANQMFDGIELVSDKLFNQDAALEYVANYYRTLSAPSGSTVYLGTSRVLSEAGVQLAQIDSTASGHYVFNTPSGAKLLAYTYTPASIASYGVPNPVYGQDRVYALPGTFTAPLRMQTAADPSALAPFPNPTAGQIKLPYAVARGSVATLEITDMAGRRVDSFRVDATFNHLLYDTQKVRPGVYLYRVVATDGSRSPASRFVVRR